MDVPEAAVYENYLTARGENKIGLAWQYPAVQSISEPKTVNQSPDQQLRLRVAATDSRHVPAAYLPRVDISHVFTGAFGIIADP
jgi:hypothetical protein